MMNKKMNKNEKTNKMKQLIFCRQSFYQKLKQIPLELRSNCMCQVVHYTLCSPFSNIKILDFNQRYKKF